MLLCSLIFIYHQFFLFNVLFHILLFSQDNKIIQILHSQVLDELTRGGSLAVVECVEQTASLYGRSLHGHHVCLLVKYQVRRMSPVWIALGFEMEWPGLKPDSQCVCAARAKQNYFYCAIFIGIIVMIIFYYYQLFHYIIIANHSFNICLLIQVLLPPGIESPHSWRQEHWRDSPI